MEGMRLEDEAIAAIRSNPEEATFENTILPRTDELLSRATDVFFNLLSANTCEAMDELALQQSEIAHGKLETTVKHFQHQLAYNVIPHIDVFLDNNYTREEAKMYYETRKIMHSDIRVSATCVRVPVMRAHSEAVWIECEDPITPDQARAALQLAPGVVVMDEPRANVYPMPKDCTSKDPVYVGRIREDLSSDYGLTFWVVGDQIKKGAALNAVQIGQYLLAHKGR